MHLAQLNLAKAKAPLDHPLMKEFVDNLEPINALAEMSAGFVWRFKDESGNATQTNVIDDPLLLPNMSVWESPQHLMQFMVKPRHAEFMKRKREWFHKQEEAHFAMWWIPKGHIPTLEEGMESLNILRTQGESPRAFSYKSLRGNTEEIRITATC